MKAKKQVKMARSVSLRARQKQKQYGIYFDIGYGPVRSRNLAKVYNSKNAATKVIKDRFIYFVMEIA